MTKWVELSARAGRNDLPAILFYAYMNRELTDADEIIKAVAEAWVGCEFPGRALETEVWAMLFDVGNLVPEAFNHNGVRDHFHLLPETLTLFRGAQVEHQIGMSWTSDRDRAIWFAQRFAHHKSGMWQVTVPRELVLAKFDDRGENEYVLDAKEFEGFGIVLEESY